MPSCAQIFGAVSGMNGEISRLMTRRLSARLYITVESSGFFAGSFASAQGAVSSIYLFARPMNAQSFFITGLISMFSIPAS